MCIFHIQFYPNQIKSSQAFLSWSIAEFVVWAFQSIEFLSLLSSFEQPYFGLKYYSGTLTWVPGVRISSYSFILINLKLSKPFVMV